MAGNIYEDIQTLKGHLPALMSPISGSVLISLYGPPCAGKTSLSRKLSAEYKIRRISMDLIRGILFPGMPDFTDKKHNQYLFEILTGYCDIVMLNKLSIISEALLIAPERKETMSNIAKKNNVPAFFIYITAELNILLKRLDNRITTGKNSEEIRAETLTKSDLNFFFEKSVPPNNKDLIIDTSHDNFNLSYEKLKQILSDFLFIS